MAIFTHPPKILGPIVTTTISVGVRQVHHYGCPVDRHDALRPDGQDLRTQPVDEARVLHFQFVGPLVNLLVGGFLGNTVFFLDFARQDFAPTVNLREFVVSQFAPLLLDSAAELFPLAGDLCPVTKLGHGQLLIIDRSSFADTAT